MTDLTRRSVLAAASLRDGAAQACPSRPISLPVPWAPGGSTDILARVAANRLHRSLGIATL